MNFKAYSPLHISYKHIKRTPKALKKTTAEAPKKRNNKNFDNTLRYVYN